MNMTIEYINRLQAAYDGASDYKAAKLLGVKQQTISNYRKERNFMSVNIAYRLAVLIEEDPALVIAETQLDHAQDPESVSMFSWMRDISRRSDCPAMPAVTGFQKI